MEFADLAREQLPRLYALARQLVGEDAEDLVQECLLKACRAYGELRDAQAAPAWLTRILVNCARDRFRAAVDVSAKPLPDAEDFSLYRVIAAEDPFPYSTLAPGLPAPVRPRGRVGRSARPEITGCPRARPHARCEHQTRRSAARCTARHAAGPVAPRAQAVRETSGPTPGTRPVTRTRAGGNMIRCEDALRAVGYL
jgi:hypothetical protein